MGGGDNAVSKAAGRAIEQSVQERAYLSDTRAESRESDSSRSPANKTACSLSALSGPEELEPVLLLFSSLSLSLPPPPHPPLLAVWPWV